MATITGNPTKSASLPKFSSIFKTGTYAIHLALNTSSTTKERSFTLVTDSRSCLQAFQKQIPKNEKIRKLKHTKANLQKIGKTVDLCWIYGHAGFPGNEIADRKAKEAPRQQEEMIACLYQEIFSSISLAIQQRWEQSGMRRIINSKKSNQIPGHGKKMVDVERMKQLSKDSEPFIHY